MIMYGGGLPRNSVPAGGVPFLSIPMIRALVHARYRFFQTARPEGFIPPPFRNNFIIPAKNNIFTQKGISNFTVPARSTGFVKGEGQTRFDQSGIPGRITQESVLGDFNATSPDADFIQTEKPAISRQITRTRRFRA